MALTDDERLPIQREFNGLFLAGADHATIAAALDEHPWLIDHPFLGKRPLWLCAAAKRHGADVLQLLLDSGCDVNETDAGCTKSPLGQAFTFDNHEVIPFLLQHGADPNLGRHLLSLLNDNNPSKRMQLLRLFIDHGIDLNNVFSMYGNYDQAFSVLDASGSAGDEIHDLLIANGAKPASQTTGRAADGPDPLIAYVSRTFGHVADRYFANPVAHGVSCCVHFCQQIKRSMLRKKPIGPITAFTYGLSWKPMDGTDGPQRAELFMQLPSNFPIGKEQAEYKWPVDWLFHGVNHREWLGAESQFLTQLQTPLPGCAFTCLMTIREDSFVRPDGETVHLYRLLPLLDDEREFVVRHGYGELLKRFEKTGTQLTDFDRQSVASESL